VGKETSGQAVPSIGSTESHDIWTERRWHRRGVRSLSSVWALDMGNTVSTESMRERWNNWGADAVLRLLRPSRGGPTSYPSALLLADAGLYTMLAPELLSFVDLFHHQHELRGLCSNWWLYDSFRIWQTR